MSYQDLPFVIHIMADTILQRPYSGKEAGELKLSSAEISELEKRRLNLTEEQKYEFRRLCDARCKLAFDLKFSWFMKCVKAKGNLGRNKLFVFLTHWMAAYLLNPEAFRLKSEAALEGKRNV